MFSQPLHFNLVFSWLRVRVNYIGRMVAVAVALSCLCRKVHPVWRPHRAQHHSEWIDSHQCSQVSVAATYFLGANSVVHVKYIIWSNIVFFFVVGGRANEKNPLCTRYTFFFCVFAFPPIGTWGHRTPRTWRQTWSHQCYVCSTTLLSFATSCCEKRWGNQNEVTAPAKISGTSKPVVWGTRGLHPKFPWGLRHYSGFRDFREYAALHALASLRA